MLISNRTARLLGAGALLLAAPALASCTEQATDQIYTPAAGTNQRDAAVDVLNAVIVTNDDQPGKGTLVVTLVNNAVDTVGSTKDVTDKLVAVGGDVSGKVKPVALPEGNHVVLATSTADIPSGVGGIPVTGDFDLGDVVEVEFDFANAGTVTLGVPVVHNIEGSQFAGQNGAPDAAVPGSSAGGHGDSAHGESSHEEPAHEEGEESHEGSTEGDEH